MIRIAPNPSSFEQVEAYLVETMFYDKWDSSGESSISKPTGTFVARWKDVENDPEPNLREILARKRKIKKALTSESDSLLRCIKVETPDGRIVYM